MGRTIPYLCNNISRPHLDLLQNLNQRLSDPRPDSQRGELILPRYQLPTRHDQRIRAGLQVRLCLLDDSADHALRAIGGGDQIRDVHFDDGQGAGCAAGVGQDFELGGCLGDVGAGEDEAACFPRGGEGQLVGCDGWDGADS